MLKAAGEEVQGSGYQGAGLVLHHGFGLGLSDGRKVAMGCAGPGLPNHNSLQRPPGQLSR